MITLKELKGAELDLFIMQTHVPVSRRNWIYFRESDAALKQRFLESYVHSIDRPTVPAREWVGLQAHLFTMCVQHEADWLPAAHEAFIAVREVFVTTEVTFADAVAALGDCHV